ncbi:MAG: hypothetical protein Q4C95_00690 [Planctomycetia bacterium]|nr:hypothetical protein [Planctomycetia bacterium]
MKRNRKLILFGTSLTICCLLYLLYSMILVPNLILPEKKINSLTNDSTSNSTNEPSKLLDQIAHKIAPLFPDPNDWRLHSAYVINPKGDFGLILFKGTPVFSKDKRMLKLAACTIILLDQDKSLSEEERYRRAIVLETNENATLSFTRPIDNFSLDFASFELGELNSRVIIRSNMKSPGPEDDFYLSTLNVSFTLKQIVAHHEVVFHFGEYDIDGEGLTIDINLPSFVKSEKQNDNEEAKEQKPVYQWINQGNLGGGVAIERIELTKLNHFKFKMDSDYLTTNLNNSSSFLTNETSPNIDSSPSPKVDTLVEIQCKNGLYFANNPDLIGGWVGRFRKDVEIVLDNPDGTTNHLTCNNLYLYFVDPELEVLAQQEKNFVDYHLKEIPTGRISELIPTKLKAIGDQESPAKINSEFYGFFAEADELIYDTIQKRILLCQTNPKQKVTLIKNDLSIQSTIIDYRMEKNRIGSVIAGGEGNIKTILNNNGKNADFNASWKNGLRIITDPNDPSLIRLSVVGGVRFEVGGIGKITAMDADFWGFMPPKNDSETVALASQESEKSFPVPPSDENNQSILNDLSLIIPQSAQFRNNVQLETPRGLAVIKNELTIRFSLQNPQDNPENDSKTNLVDDPDHPNAKKQGVFFAESGSLFSDEQKSQFLLKGDLLDLWLILNGQNDVNVSRIVLRENVLLQENGLENQQEMINIQGDEVRIENPDSDKTEVLLVGETARFEGKGLMLSGKNINVSRAKNSFTVLGPGKLSFVPDTSKLLSSLQTTQTTQLFQKDQLEQTNNVAEVDQVNPTDQPVQSSHSTFADQHFSFNKSSDKKKVQNVSYPQNADSFLTSDQKISQESSTVLKESQSDAVLKDRLLSFISDDPVNIVWSKQMNFDGQNLFFQALPNQNIDVTQGNQKIRCPEIKLSLPKKISIFDLNDENDKSFDIDLIECLGDLSHPIEIELFSAQSDIESQSVSNIPSNNVLSETQNNRSEINGVYRAQFKNLQFRRSTGKFIAEGPGWIRTTIKTPIPEESNQTSISENSKSTVAKTSMSFRPWTQAHLTFQKEIEGNVYQKELKAQNMVNCVVCTTDQFESSLNIENPATFPQDSVFLICQKLLGTIVKNPITNDEAIEMTASENTLLRYKNIVIRSETINYSDVKKTIRFAGDGINAASIHKQEYPGATVQSLGKYMRASYNLETEKIEVEQYSNSGN